MFDISPQVLLGAAEPIPAHALVAIATALLGLWQILGQKGTRRHRVVGWAFVVGMAYVALSALFISELHTWGYFSPIHLLIPVTLATLWKAVRDARAGRIKSHARSMIILFALAVVVTGGLTVLPGRIMHEAVFGEPAGK